ATLSKESLFLPATGFMVAVGDPIARVSVATGGQSAKGAITDKPPPTAHQPIASPATAANPHETPPNANADCAVNCGRHGGELSRRVTGFASLGRGFSGVVGRLNSFCGRHTVKDDGGGS